MIERYTTPEVSAIWSRQAKYERWKQVEIEVARAWAEAGVIPQEDFQQIESKADFSLERCDEIEAETRHDLAAFVRCLEESVGEAGRWIHFGVTSYDIIDTALAGMLLDSCDVLIEEMKSLTSVVEELAAKHKGTPMIGRTHGIHAEPITFGFKCSSWLQELKRNSDRLAACKSDIATGKISGAVGVHAHVEPQMEAQILERLGLKADKVSTQIVNRDRHANLVFMLALVCAGMERIATELRNLQRTEILEVQESFAPGQTGSSAMPHKRNPWSSETVVGLARVVRGHAGAMLECVATWHERDLTNSATERIVLPDAIHATHFCIRRVRTVLGGLTVNEARMAQNMRMMGDLVFSEHLMSALIRAGLTRAEAYKIAQRNAARAWDGEDFRNSVESDPDVTARLGEAALEQVFDLDHHLRNADISCG